MELRAQISCTTSLQLPISKRALTSLECIVLQPMRHRLICYMRFLSLEEVQLKMRLLERKTKTFIFSLTKLIQDRQCSTGLISRTSILKKFMTTICLPKKQITTQMISPAITFILKAKMEPRCHSQSLGEKMSCHHQMSHSSQYLPISQPMEGLEPVRSQSFLFKILLSSRILEESWSQPTLEAVVKRALTGGKTAKKIRDRITLMTSLELQSG